MCLSGHAVLVKAAAITQYHPVIESEGMGFVTQTHTYRIQTTQPYTGTVTWYVNGEKQTATSTAFMPTFALPGYKTITARLNNTLEQAEIAVTIQSYSGIVLESLLPNPIQPDAEEVVVHNTNAFPVTLRDWRLQSQASRALVPISVVIEPKSSIIIKVTNKLINNGGAYGLYNEANQLVDRVSYGMAPPGERLYRTQTQWRFPSFDVEVEEPSTGVVGEPVPESGLNNELGMGGPMLIRAAATLPEPPVPFQVWVRVWINFLVLSGFVLLSSCWEKPV